MNIRHSFLLPATLLMPLVWSSAVAQVGASDPLHAWVVAKTPAALTTWVSERLAAEQKDVAALVAVTGARTIENTLRPFDDAQNELAIAGDQAFLLYSLADGADMRDKAQAELNRISSASTDLSLNQNVYKALAQVPLPTGTTGMISRQSTTLNGRFSNIASQASTRTKPPAPGSMRCRTRSRRSH